MKITILGSGAWGCSLAKLLELGNHSITLWSNLPQQLTEISQNHRNESCLPGIVLPSSLRVETDIQLAITGSEIVVVAVPSKPFRDVTRVLKEFRGIVVSVTKGIEYDSGLTMSGILEENAPYSKIVALSGPTLALEVAQGIPTAIVAASKCPSSAQFVQQLFHRPSFRVYTSSDILGVELGGALKNVIAIAAGVSDGLGFGDNSKAALITRGIVEIRRLGVACGAQTDTFAGLSGLGDLTVTCFSRLSRNRGLGERLGRREKLTDIVASMVAVAEGVPTARSAHQLALRHSIITPIINQVYSMLYEQTDVAQALHALLSRDSKAEA